MDFSLLTQIISGLNCVIASAEVFMNYGKRALLVTGQNGARICGALDDAMNALSSAGIAFQLFDKVAPNPTVASCIEAGTIAREFGAEFILGIGGGSPIDAAKAAAVFAANPILDEDGLYALAWTAKPLPIIIIGTTAGTGSEVTPVSVLTNTAGFKKSARHRDLYPTIAFGDPRYTYTLGEETTRSTAADALSHCVESFLSRKANELSKTFAVRGIKLIASVFAHDQAFSFKLSNIGAQERERLYFASLYGGLAIGITGTLSPHALGYYLTESHAIAHGTACAVFLPALIEQTLSANPSVVRVLCTETGLSVAQLNELTRVLIPKIPVKLKLDEIIALVPRWNGNTSIAYAWGSTTPEYLEELFSSLF